MVWAVGVLVSFDSTAWTAVVDIRGGVPYQRLSGIAVNRGLASAAVTAGRQVAILFYGNSLNEAVVMGVWV